ncbi:lantibiotic dehydratase [Streptomyces erythrochromogenes]|uniref:lantibiotic dehydratase n=1 Tax=Streptomyces erythrochromogenes TaxID=285574 RepID=UPI00369B2008
MHHFTGTGYWVSPLLAVRVAGVPAGNLTALRGSRTWTAVDSLIPAYRWLTDEGRQLSGILSSLQTAPSPAVADGLRPGVAAVRSALAGLDAPGEWVWAQQLWRTLPPEVYQRFEQWLGELERYRPCAAELAGIHATEIHAANAALRTSVAGRDFRLGLLQSRPDIHKELDNWLQDPSLVPRGAVLRRLARQIARAATQPGRYTSFTVTAGGTFLHNSSVPAPPPAAGTEGYTKSVVEPDLWTLQQLAWRLATHPELADRLGIRVNPTTTEDAGRLWFISSAPGEPVLRVSCDETVLTCLRLVREASEEATLGGLRDDLLTLGSTSQQIDALIDRLAGIGLLELRLPFADQADDHLSHLLAWTTQEDHPPATSRSTPPAPSSDTLGTRSGTRNIASPLRELRRLLRTYEDSDNPRERAATRIAVQNVLHSPALRPSSGYGFHGPSHPQTLARATRAPDGITARSPLHEDRLADGSVKLPWQRWQPVCDDLDNVRRLAGLFDADLPLKLTLASVLHDRFPRGTGFLSFYRYVQQSAHAVHDPAPGRIGAAELQARLAGPAADCGPGTLADSGLDAVQQLADLRLQALALLGDGPQPPRNPADPVDIEPSLITDLLDTLPAHIRPPDSLTCFVQALGAGDPARPQRLVLSGLGTGFGSGRAQFDRLHKQRTRRTATPDGTEPHRPHYSCTDPGRVYAETDGVFGSNLNLRAPGVAHRIDYPFTTTSAHCTAEQRIQLTDLQVALDPVTGLPILHSSRLNATVVPLHLGSMAIPLLPPALRFLVRGFGMHGATHRPPWEAAAPAPSTQQAGDGILSLPRAQMGLLTLRRATWWLPVRLFPVRRPSEPEHAHLVRLATWLDQHHMPREFFAQVRPGGASRPTVPGEPGSAPTSLYVDVTVQHLLSSFTRSLPVGRRAHTDVLVLQEALPSADHTAAEHHGGSQEAHAAEYALEINALEVRCA